MYKHTRRTRVDYATYPHLLVQDDVGIGARVLWSVDDHGQHACGTLFRQYHCADYAEACATVLYHVRAYVYGWDWEKREDERERGIR
jgi:hypothetical protein